VYGFTFKDEAYEYDLPQTGHFPREAFERWLGKEIKYNHLTGGGVHFAGIFIHLYYSVLLKAGMESVETEASTNRSSLISFLFIYVASHNGKAVMS
jgi:hypothetical protein